MHHVDQAMDCDGNSSLLIDGTNTDIASFQMDCIGDEINAL